MRRYWITFVREPKDIPATGVVLGVGVTAPSIEAAFQIIRRQMFADEEMPKVKGCIEDVDVSTLDANHVLPNMGVPALHGIWFPLGFTQPSL